MAPASEVVDMSLCLADLDLCKRCRCPVAEASEANDLCGLYLDLRLCPAGDENVCRDRRLQLSNDLSLRDCIQTSPCNPRRHWREVASRQAEEEVEEEHQGLRRLTWSVQSPWRMVCIRVFPGCPTHLAAFSQIALCLSTNVRHVPLTFPFC